VIKGRWGQKGFALAFAHEKVATVIEMMELLHDDFSAMVFAGQKAETFSATFTTGMTRAPLDGDHFEALRDKAVQRLLDSIHERLTAAEST
jgi:GGDEF domain-containing protein